MEGRDEFSGLSIIVFFCLCFFFEETNKRSQTRSTEKRRNRKMLNDSETKNPRCLPVVAECSLNAIVFELTFTEVCSNH